MRTPETERISARQAEILRDVSYTPSLILRNPSAGYPYTIDSFDQYATGDTIPLSGMELMHSATIELTKDLDLAPKAVSGDIYLSTSTVYVTSINAEEDNTLNFTVGTPETSALVTHVGSANICLTGSAMLFIDARPETLGSALTCAITLEASSSISSPVIKSTNLWSILSYGQINMNTTYYKQKMDDFKVDYIDEDGAWRSGFPWVYGRHPSSSPQELYLPIFRYTDSQGLAHMVVSTTDGIGEPIFYYAFGSGIVLDSKSSLSFDLYIYSMHNQNSYTRDPAGRIKIGFYSDAAATTLIDEATLPALGTNWKLGEMISVTVNISNINGTCEAIGIHDYITDYIGMNFVIDNLRFDGDANKYPLYTLDWGWNSQTAITYRLNPGKYTKVAMDTIGSSGLGDFIISLAAIGQR